MKIVFVGCLDAGWLILRNLVVSGFEIAYVVTLTEEIAKNAKVAGYNNYSDLTTEHQIPVYEVKSYGMKDERDVEFFKKNKFDLLVQGGWQRLFPNEILNTLSIGSIGVHGSAEPLPRGRGRSPINWSIIEGRTRFIFHYFLMKPGVDDGDIFCVKSVDINEWDTCQTLYYKNSIVTSQVLEEYIPKLFKNETNFYPQSGVASYYPKRTADDSLIDWNKPLLEVHRLIRAVTEPYPLAFTYFNSEKVEVIEAQPFDTRILYEGMTAGQIVEIFSNGEFVVYLNDGLLLIKKYRTSLNLCKGNILGRSS